MSDDLIGGFSVSKFEHVNTGAATATDTATTPPSPSSSSSQSPTTTATTAEPTSYARFHGSISTDLPEDKPSIKRTGYAAFRTPVQAATLFGRSVWDIDPYTYLALRVKSDGRAYFINVQTEGVEPTDLHQRRLFAKRPGRWETVLVRWNDFVRTSYGFVMEPQTEMLRQKVQTVGVGLTDRVEGPFELCIERVWATNTVEEGQTVIEGEASEFGEEEGQLKNKKGERIQW